MEFIIGQKVICVRAESSSRLKEGDIYTISDVKRERKFVNLEEIGNLNFYASRFKPYKEVKIGSKVRCLMDMNLIKRGDIYEVVEIYETRYRVKTPHAMSGYATYNKERFELVDDNVEAKVMSREDRILEVVNNWKKGNFEEDLRDAKNRYDRAVNALSETKRNLTRYLKIERESMNKVIELEKKMKEKVDFSSDIKAILDNDLVEKVEAEGKTLLVYTDYIKIHDNEGNVFAGNKYRLEFNYNAMECLIYGLDENYNRVSWWSNRYDKSKKDYHPHVNGRNGEACWGSAGEMLTYAMNDYELYASFTVVLGFLQQVNLNDPAGEFIRNWDCIDENEDVIDNPYETTMATCHVCDREVDEEDIATCYDCENHMCETHERYIESIGEYVCDNCYDDNYSRCDDCDEIFRNEDVQNCHSCGDTICESCRTCAPDDNYYCKTCYDNRYTNCTSCSEEIEIEDTFRCDRCDHEYCTSCDTRHEYETETLCEGCYEDAIEEEDEDEN